MSDQNTRRNFLKLSTLVGLGITANPLSAFSTSNDEEKNVGKLKTEIKAGQQLVSLLQTIVLVDTKKNIRGYYEGTNPDEIKRLITEINKLKNEN